MTPGGLPFEVPMRPPEEEEHPSDHPDAAAAAAAQEAAAAAAEVAGEDEAGDVHPEPAEEMMPPVEGEEHEREQESVEITRRAERSGLSMGGISAVAGDVSLGSTFQDNDAGLGGACVREAGGRWR